MAEIWFGLCHCCQRQCWCPGTLSSCESESWIRGAPCDVSRRHSWSQLELIRRNADGSQGMPGPFVLCSHQWSSFIYHLAVYARLKVANSPDDTLSLPMTSDQRTHGPKTNYSTTERIRTHPVRFESRVSMRLPSIPSCTQLLEIKSGPPITSCPHWWLLTGWCSRWSGT